MSARSAARLAWTLWAATLGLVAGAHVLGLAGRGPLYEYWLEATLIGLTFATLGALIVSRRAGNVIGWLFLVPAMSTGMQFFSGQYATVALSGSTPLPAGAYAAWLATLAQASAVFSIPFLMMLFPTGRLLSPRWRVLAWTLGLLAAFGLTSFAIHPGPIQDFAPTRNPFGVGAVTEIPDLLYSVTSWMVVACLLAVIVSLILRFYRSRGEERLQLKWFVCAAAVGIMAILLSDLVPAAFGGWLSNLAWTVAPLGLPISAGVAILRYRLYDIDLVINRTLVCGLLTVTLAATYAGSVVLLQGVFRAATGGASQLIVVVSTLVIAALFSPLRRRIQAFIDHIFYRRKYDAAKTLRQFTTTLRDEVGPEALQRDLISVVEDTVQPEHVSLWLRPPEEGG